MGAYPKSMAGRPDSATRGQWLQQSPSGQRHLRAVLATAKGLCVCVCFYNHPYSTLFVPAGELATVLLQLATGMSNFDVRAHAPWTYQPYWVPKDFRDEPQKLSTGSC